MFWLFEMLTLKLQFQIFESLFSISSVDLRVVLAAGIRDVKQRQLRVYHWASSHSDQSCCLADFWTLFWAREARETASCWRCLSSNTLDDAHISQRDLLLLTWMALSSLRPVSLLQGDRLWHVTNCRTLLHSCQEWSIFVFTRTKVLAPLSRPLMGLCRLPWIEQRVCLALSRATLAASRQLSLPNEWRCSCFSVRFHPRWCCWSRRTAAIHAF